MRRLKSRLRSRYLAAITMLRVTTHATACGESDLQNELFNMIHDDTRLALTCDVAAVSAGETYHEFSVEDEWDDTVGQVGILMDETDTMLVGFTQMNPCIALKGEFDLDCIRRELEDNGCERDLFSGYEVWNGGALRNAAAIVLLEDSVAVLGGMDSDVRDILRDLSRDSGSDDTTGPMRAMAEARDGWLQAGIEGCPNELRRYEGAAYSISTGERFELAVRHSFMPGDGRSDETARDDVEAMIEHSEEHTWEDVSIPVYADFVTVAGRIDEDDFYESLSGYGVRRHPRLVSPMSDCAGPRADALTLTIGRPAPSSRHHGDNRAAAVQDMSQVSPYPGGDIIRRHSPDCETRDIASITHSMYPQRAV